MTFHQQQQQQQRGDDGIKTFFVDLRLLFIRCFLSDKEEKDKEIRREKDHNRDDLDNH